MSVYAQVFFFVTFLENRKKIIVRKGKIKLANYPAVTVVVPCWNEERTVYRTVQSLLRLNYPKDKLQIFLIDDGSTDSTWAILNKFAKYPNIQIFRKENGGKILLAILARNKEHVLPDYLNCIYNQTYNKKLITIYINTNNNCDATEQILRD